MKSSSFEEQPIPSIAHLIWTGNGPMPLQYMKDIAKVASFGKRIGSQEDGLEIHLWVDNTAKFQSQYEKMRADVMLSDVAREHPLPKDLNCVIHSISELSLNGGNGFDKNSNRSKLTESLLMKAEAYKGPGRNKGAQSSDIIRGLILDQKGGVYFDIRTALTFAEGLKKEGKEKFAPVPDRIESNFLSVIPADRKNAGGAGYTIARPNTMETNLMLSHLYERILVSHQLRSDKYPSHLITQVGVDFNRSKIHSSYLGTGDSREAREKLMAPRADLMKAESEASKSQYSYDSQSRMPEVMRTGYDFGHMSRSNSLGGDILMHTTGWVFTDVVNSIRNPDEMLKEAKDVTNAIFGTDKDNNLSLGGWLKAHPSKEAIYDDGNHAQKGIYLNTEQRKSILERDQYFRDQIKDDTDVKEIIAAISTTFDSIETPLTHKEINALNAIRRLARSDSTYFLAASDHLIENKDILLEKTKDKPVLRQCVDDIFQAREDLGFGNIRIKDRHPLFYTILTKDKDGFAHFINSRDPASIRLAFDEEMVPKSTLTLFVDKQTALHYFYKSNDYELAKILAKKIAENLDELESLYRGRAGNVQISPDKDFNMLKGFLEVVSDYPEWSQALSLFGMNSIYDEDRVGAIRAITESDKIVSNPDALHSFLRVKDFFRTSGNVLHTACGNNESEVTRVISESKMLSDNPASLRKILTARNDQGRNPLMYGVSRKAVREIDPIFIQNLDIFKDVAADQDNQGNNIFHLAIKHNSFEIIEKLINNLTLVEDPHLLPQLLRDQNKYGRFPLQELAGQQKTQGELGVSLLLQNGAFAPKGDYGEYNNKVKRAQNNSHHLIQVINKGNQELKRAISTMSDEELKEAINLPVDIGYMTSKFRTPLQYAAQLGKVEEVATLMDNGAKVGVMNSKGRTAFDYAQKAGKHDVVETLHARGIQVTSATAMVNSRSPVVNI